MSRRLVYFCLTILTLSSVWAMVLKTVASDVDLTDVLTFVGGVFGGELLMLLLKRIFAKPTETEDFENEI